MELADVLPEPELPWWRELPEDPEEEWCPLGRSWLDLETLSPSEEDLESFLSSFPLIRARRSPPSGILPCVVMEEGGGFELRYRKSVAGNRTSSTTSTSLLSWVGLFAALGVGGAARWEGSPTLPLPFLLLNFFGACGAGAGVGGAGLALGEGAEGLEKAPTALLRIPSCRWSREAASLPYPDTVSAVEFTRLAQALWRSLILASKALCLSKLMA